MMSDQDNSFGFKRRGEAKEPPAEPLGLSGIPRGPIHVSPEAERQLDERSARLGYVSREREGGEGSRVRRNREAQPMRSIYIKGPQELVDWFIEFTNDGNYKSYWEALAELRSQYERRGY